MGMKRDRNGQAKILTDSEVSAIFSLFSERDKAIFAVCLYTGARISESISLRTGDITAGVITIRKENTKGKKRSRSIPISPNLEEILKEYLAIASPNDFLFPGRYGSKPLTTAYADLVLRQACSELGLKGISTHSFRRTALTRLHLSNVPLRTIQRISGHSSLSELAVYLEVSEENIRDAVGLI
jgi:integrase/recombinase XerD